MSDLREARRYAVRPMAGGWAVFGTHGTRVSEIFARKADAIAEAKTYVGGDGVLEIETETGHTEAEHIERPR